MQSEFYRKYAIRNWIENRRAWLSSPCGQVFLNRAAFDSVFGAIAWAARLEMITQEGGDPNDPSATILEDFDF